MFMRVNAECTHQLRPPVPPAGERPGAVARQGVDARSNAMKSSPNLCCGGTHLVQSMPS